MESMLITMPAWVRLGLPIAYTRRPVTLAPVLWAIVGAVRRSVMPASNSRLRVSRNIEGRLGLLLPRSFPGEPFIDGCQFIRRRVVFGTGEFCLDFERKLC